jgi:hypothetical protein
LTRRGTVALLAWTAYLVLANVAWLRVELPQRPPSWDRGLYLYLSVRFLHALEDGGPAALLEEFAHRSTTVAPLFPLTTVAGYLVAGDSRLAAHAVTSLYLLLLLAATYALGRRLYGAPAGVLAAFALSCFPGVTLSARDYLMDFPAAALATAAVALLVEADFGRRRGAALAFGALTGLTLLTKTMALVFLAAPIAEAFWRSRRDRRACANLAASLLLALLVASCWWGPNHAAALGYLWRYGFTPDALPFAAGGASLLSPPSLAYYPAALVNEGLGPLAALLLVLALLLVARPDAFLLRWFGVALAVLTLVPNKSGDRYILGLLPPLALALGGAIARIASPPRQRAAVATLVLAGLYVHASLTYDASLPRLYVHVSTGVIAVSPAVPANAAWPVVPALEAADTAARQARARIAALAPPPPGHPEALVRAAYGALLKREPDAEGLAAYARELERGTLTPAGLLRALAASREFQARPARVLVVTDHPFVNASVLRYYAERARRALEFEHPTENLPEGDLADRYDAAIVKHGGGQGPAHTTALIPALQLRLASGNARWRVAAPRLRCPDGGEIEVWAAEAAW